MSDAIIEGLKQLGRVALFAVLPLLISGLQAGVVDLRAVAIAGAIAILSGIDKWLHKADEAKDADEQKDEWLGGKGLAGF
jgi:hypothetical protein